jgi:TolB-like protein
MSKERLERRLSAILAADVVGYSRLMGLDEEGTLAALKICRRELLDPKIAEHRGRVVKTTGDGALVEFASAVDATRCAMEIQRAMTERNVSIPEDHRINFRIGINVGDIIVDEDDIYGDGVNIAARLEAIAEPGGISISEDSWRQVEGKVAAHVVDLGLQDLKNISKRVRVYRIDLNEKGAARPKAKQLPLPAKPSIAVLPFTNMSGDPEQDYFADGMVEDIITELARLPSLFVIARNSSFVYKGRAVDLKQVGRELGVRYILEGGVRKVGNRVRVTGQLIDAGTGAHIWAERFDGALDDIFELQDEVTSKVVSALAPRIERAELDQAKYKPTDSLSAYDCYIRGRASFKGNGTSRRSIDEALPMFERAIALDPDFSSAYGMAAWCYLVRNNNGWLVEPVKQIERMVSLAKQAVRLGRDDPLALGVSGAVHSQVLDDLTTAATLLDRAVALAPSLAVAWHMSGWIRINLGQPELAVEHLERAMRLDPLDPLLYNIQTGIAAAHFLASRYDEAATWAERALHELPRYKPALRLAAASYALAGQIGKAQDYIGNLLAIDPALRCSNLAGLVPFRAPADAERYAGGLRKAGLPA